MNKSVHSAASRPTARKWLAAAAGVAMAAAGAFSPAKAQDTIKVGVLHSLSGTMAISETTLKDTILFLIDEHLDLARLGGRLRAADGARCVGGVKPNFGGHFGFGRAVVDAAALSCPSNSFNLDGRSGRVAAGHGDEGNHAFLETQSAVLVQAARFKCGSSGCADHVDR